MAVARRGNIEIDSLFEEVDRGLPGSRLISLCIDYPIS